MAALPLIDSVGRIVHRPLSGSIPVVQNLTLWITFVGAVLAASSDRLLAMSTAEFVPQRIREGVRVFTSALAAGITGWLAIAAVEMVQVEREAGDIVAWGIPTWVSLAIIPAGFGAVAARVVWRSSGTWQGRTLALAGLTVPVATWAWPDVPATMIAGPLTAIGIATALGMPIYAAIGGAALLFSVREGVPAASVPGEIYRLSASPMLPSLPLFTLAGFILSESGASKRLMRLFTAMIGWMPGGLAIVTALLLAFFTPFTGASGVTILSMGGLLLPMMLRDRYPENTSIGLVTVSGSIGLLLPPSLPVILYGISAQVPIDELFLAGIVPGFILIAAVATWAAWTGWRSGASRTRFCWGELRGAAWQCKWELLLPVVVIVGLFGGFVTLVESAAVTVLYAVVIECFIHKDLRVRTDLPRIAVESATLVGGFLIILGVALGFTNFLIQAEVPMQLLAWVKSHITSPLVFLLLLNVFLLIVGAAMDIYSAILVIVPLIAPLGLAYDISPVHLGIVFLANMELGYLTPPMGENLFLSSYRFKQSLGKICLATVPYWLMLLGAVLLITYLPMLGK